ncbi:MAG: GH3 auxin-responsive promoter family protein, partial [Muribaculaceae bacterium]|nr:GH3 auxin-responsive promoter family protein [Muribaculaceae bacterium]
RKGRHQWLIEWTLPPACGNEAFADILDAELQKVNSDYQAKRAGDIFLDRLILTQASPGLFDRWLESTGRLGGQRKIPRLANDRQLMDRLLEINTQ